eukprot:COSAG02_NODE_29691_length_565_cov_0.577253_1_plen_162_part_01
MDCDLAMALMTATTDNDEKCPDDVMKKIVRSYSKEKDAGLADLTGTLTAKLNFGSFKMKLKTLRATMMMLNDRNSAKFKAAARGSSLHTAVEGLVEFTMEPDPTHGDRPQQMVRQSAKKCLDMIGTGDGDDEGGGGFAAKANAKAKAEQAPAQARARAKAGP